MSSEKIVGKGLALIVSVVLSLPFSNGFPPHLDRDQKTG
jgi:hypothetical protein